MYLTIEKIHFYSKFLPPSDSGFGVRFVSLYLKLLQAKKKLFTLDIISEVAETNIFKDVFLYSANFLKEL